MKHSHHQKEKGFTLLELTVVLLVLVALAGVMIPYATGYVGRSHDSTGANNISEINNAIQRHEAQFFAYPDALDSLMDDDALGGNAGTIGAGTPLMGAAQFAATTLTAAQVVQLNNAGIDTVTLMDPAAASATFNNTTVEYTLDNAAGDTVLGFSAGGLTNLSNALGVDTTVDTWVAFGVGPDSQLNGRTMSEAPVHFPMNSTAGTPDTIYNRFLAVFRIPAAGGAATYAGSVAPMMPLLGLNGHLQQFYSDNFGG